MEFHKFRQDKLQSEEQSQCQMMSLVHQLFVCSWAHQDEEINADGTKSWYQLL